jgi:pSer/pThr/pTyr-binding forkhead associated (FHA) protein
MAKLIISLEGLVQNEFALTKERTTIGRKPHNDIQIDNLAVSGEHAAVVTIGNDCFLEDLGSTNGTLVNGAPVKRHILRNSDVIELGKYKLMFVGKSPAPAAADYEKTMVWRPATSKQAGAQDGAAVASQSSAPGNPAGAGARGGAGPSTAPAPPISGPSAPARPIWKIGLVLLAILIVGFLTYGMRG